MRSTCAVRETASLGQQMLNAPDILHIPDISMFERYLGLTKVVEFAVHRDAKVRFVILTPSYLSNHQEY